MFKKKIETKNRVAYNIKQIIFIFNRGELGFLI